MLINEAEKWVLFDLDDVVFNFREQWYNASHKEGIEIPHWKEWPSYDDLKYFKFNNQVDLQAMFIKHQCLESCSVEPDALYAMLNLKDKGFKIGALTARSWHPKATEITLDSFARNHLPVDKLVLSGLHFDSKSSHMHKFGEGNIIGFIDDSPKHVQDFLNQGVSNVYLRNRPWNKSIQEYTPTVRNLTEFSEQVINQQYFLSKNVARNFRI